MRRLGGLLVITMIWSSLLAAPAAAAGDTGGSMTFLRVITVIAVFGVVLAVGVLLGGFGFRHETDLRTRLGKVAPQRGGGRGLARFGIVRRMTRGAEQVARRRGVLDAVDAAIDRTGLPLRPGEGLAVAVVGSIVAGLIAGLAGRSVLLGAAVATGGVIILLVAIQAVASHEKGRFDSQLPDTLNLIASSLRAGYSLLQAVEATAQESAEPTSREFQRALSEIRLGESVAGSLRRIAARMGSIDFEWVVQAVEIQTEVGGNLSEVLSNAGDTVLARTRLRREVRALTAEGRISAIVLIALPFGLFGFLWATNRSYLDPLFASTGGKLAMVGATALVVAGIVWIRNIVNIEP